MLARTSLKQSLNRLLTPPARGLLAAGVSPDAVTLVGTVGVSAAALWFFPRGQFLAGVLVIMVFVFSDSLDGQMARLAGRSGRWGAFLDSTLDRISDAAIFSGLVLWFAGEGDDLALVAASLLCLVGGFMVSYARARAEGLGFEANVGFAERTERLVIVLLGVGLAGLGVPYVLPVALWLLAALSWITLVQRMLYVRKQATAPLVQREPETTRPTTRPTTSSPTTMPPQSPTSTPPTGQPRERPEPGS